MRGQRIGIGRVTGLQIAYGRHDGLGGGDWRKGGITNLGGAGGMGLGGGLHATSGKISSKVNSTFIAKLVKLTIRFMG